MPICHRLLNNLPNVDSIWLSDAYSGQFRVDTYTRLWYNANMTHSIQNSKSILAKALAEENISVEHSPNAHTAMFDVVNRVLTLPVWDNITDEVYDLFVGHEVGHALFTPDIDKDSKTDGPWTHEAERIGGNVHASYVQMLMNVVEDVRIERLVKERFPGLRRDFAVGYRNLFENNFFGTNDKDINTMSFGDRLNLHFKIGVHLNVPFNAEEQELVDAIERVSSFDDTVKLTEKIFNLIGGKRQHVELPNTDAPTPISSSNGNGDGQKGNGSSSVPNNENANNQNQNANRSSQSENGNDPNSVRTDAAASAPLGAGTGYVPNALPKMFTQTSFDEQMKTKVNHNIRAVVTTELPIANIDNIILPYNKAQKMIGDSIDSYRNGSTSKVISNIQSQYEKTMRNTRPIIAQLIQQFEMKKAADIQKRTSVSRSGKIDCDRIFKYRVSDDIFARYATVADGKNHGMVMFIDWSSSMQLVTLDVLNQVVMLTQFCKRMGIPFEVYLFSSQHMILRDHLGIKNADDLSYDDLAKKMNQWKSGRNKRNCISNAKSNANYLKSESMWQENDNHESFALIQVLSSDMTAKEFTDGSFNLYALGHLITQHPNMYEGVQNLRRIYAPNDLGQGNTPLDSTILAAMQIVPRFQQNNKVQIVNTIFLTDGETGHSHFYSSMYSSEKSFVNCPLTKKQYCVNGYPTSTDALLMMFREHTKSNVIGFYIANRHCRYFDPTLEPKQHMKNLKETGFYDAPTRVKTKDYNYTTRSYETSKVEKISHGYDRLFIIPSQFDGEPESVEDALGALDSNASLARIRNTFIKSVEKRSASRGFINRFSDVISAPTR